VASLAKGVEMQRTYYWRVDEISGSDTWTNDSPYDIWSFSTPGYLIVDDIERYPNTTIIEDANQIYNIWADGFNNSTVNGALLGNQTGNPLQPLFFTAVRKLLRYSMTTQVLYDVRNFR